MSIIIELNNTFYNFYVFYNTLLITYNSNIFKRYKDFDFRKKSYQKKKSQKKSPTEKKFPEKVSKLIIDLNSVFYAQTK
jgi:hypothetical protein